MSIRDDGWESGDYVLEFQGNNHVQQPTNKHYSKLYLESIYIGSKRLNTFHGPEWLLTDCHYRGHFWLSETLIAQEASYDRLVGNCRLLTIILTKSEVHSATARGDIVFQRCMACNPAGEVSGFILTLFANNMKSTLYLLSSLLVQKECGIEVLEYLLSNIPSMNNPEKKIYLLSGNQNAANS